MKGKRIAVVIFALSLLGTGTTAQTADTQTLYAMIADLKSQNA